MILTRMRSLLPSFWLRLHLKGGWQVLVGGRTCFCCCRVCLSACLSVCAWVRGWAGAGRFCALPVRRNHVEISNRTKTMRTNRRSFVRFWVPDKEVEKSFVSTSFWPQSNSRRSHRRRVYFRTLELGRRKTKATEKVPVIVQGHLESIRSLRAHSSTFVWLARTVNFTKQ